MSKLLLPLCSLLFLFTAQTKLYAEMNIEIKNEKGLAKSLINLVANNQSLDEDVLKDVSQEVISKYDKVQKAIDMAGKVSQKAKTAITASQVATLLANNDQSTDNKIQNLNENFSRLTDSTNYINTGTGTVTLANSEGYGGLKSTKSVTLNIDSETSNVTTSPKGQTATSLLNNASFTTVSATKDLKSVVLDEESSNTLVASISGVNPNTISAVASDFNKSATPFQVSKESIVNSTSSVHLDVRNGRPLPKAQSAINMPH